MTTPQPPAEPNWLPVKDCAAELGVAPSSVTRYVQKHGITARRSGKEKLVDFAELEAHWRANYSRHVMSGDAGRGEASPASPTHPVNASPASPAPPNAPAAAAPPRSPARSPNSRELDLSDPAVREKHAKADIAELGAAKMRGELVSPDRAIAMASDFGAAIVETAELEIGPAADQLLADLNLPAERSTVVRKAMRILVDRIRERGADALTRAAAELAGETEGEMAALIAHLEAEIRAWRAGERAQPTETVGA